MHQTNNLPIRVGVAGVGHLGYHHARLYRTFDNADLVGIADIDPEKRAKAAADFCTTGVESAEQLIELGVEAVSVATPTLTHFETVAAFLRAGIHVLVEKPMASSVAQAEEMVTLAREKGCRLQVGHIERFNGAVMALFDAIQRARFIECHRLSPFPGRGTDVSVILDLMIHDLDIVLALEPSEILSIDAVGVPVFSKSEDIANVRIRFASGCVANVTSSRVSLDRMRKIRIFAENAYVSTDYSAQEVLVYRKKTGDLPPDFNPMECIEIEALSVRKEEPLKLELMSFLQSVKTGARPIVSGEEGLKALRLAQRIVAFIRENA